MERKIEGDNTNDLNVALLKKNKLIYKGRFLSYFIKNFEINDPNKNMTMLKQYETVDYNSRCFSQSEIPNEFIGKNNYNIYAINIIPIIKYSQKPKKLIIVSVFRYPINKFCLEFPAGFMDKADIDSSGEDFPNAIKKAALRELEEETGYKGDFICNTSKYFGKNNNLEEELKIGGNIFFDPWKSSDNAIQCIVEINGDQFTDKREQKLDDTEYINVYEIEIKDLMNFIYEKMNKEQWGCSSELYNFALGLNFNSIINDILYN